MSEKYLIADEPRHGTLGQYVVHPQWPMLAQMLAGTWLALPWFIFNSIALGSPNKNKDMQLAFVSITGSGILFLLLSYLVKFDVVFGVWIPLSFLIIVALKLYIAYLLYFSQSNVFGLWKYYGAVEKNGMPVLLLCSFFVRPYLAKHINNHFLYVILF